MVIVGTTKSHGSFIVKQELLLKKWLCDGHVSFIIYTDSSWVSCNALSIITG